MRLPKQSPGVDRTKATGTRREATSAVGIAPQDCDGYPEGTIIGCQMCGLLGVWMDIPCGTAPSCQC